MRFLSSFGRWVQNSFIFKHRFIFGAVFLLVGAVALFGPTHFSFAVSSVEVTDAAYGQMLLWIAGIINVITGYIAKFSLSIIEMIIVPILQYSNFSSSPTIGLGWSLVRDVVNMFVIIILLVIAIATVVGYKKISWEQALPQFLLAVILVNFSRTICGILIDVSQVIMFTFVNALLDVAAGNFAVLLGYDNFGQYSNSAVYDPTTGASKYIDAAQQVGAAYMLFVLYASIFAVLLLLALVYIWRIVVLWVLVIMSPLTFFLGGLKGMFKFADGANGEWWKKFTACLVLGPMLTFFLWLALATGTGDIVESEGFPQSDSTLSATLVSFETSHLLGTLLGLILLVVGMQQSASFANSMGGVAASVINEKMGRKIVSGVARAPIGVGRELARQTDRRVGGALGQPSATAFLAGQLGGGLSTAASRLPGGSYLGRTVAGVTGAIQAPLEHQIHEEKKAAKDRIGKYTNDQLLQHVSLMAAGKNSAIALSTREDLEAIQIKALTDGDFRKKMKKDLSGTEYKSFMGKALEMSDDHIKHAGGDLDKVAKAKAQNAHLLEEKKDVVKLVQSDKFSGRDLSAESAANKDVLEAMKDKVVRLNNEGKPVTAYEELIRGAYGKDLALAARNASIPNVYDSSSAAAGQPTLADLRPAETDKAGHVTAPARPYTAEEIAGNITAQRINPEKLSAADFDGPNQAALTTAVIDTDSIQKLSAASREAFEGIVDGLPKGSLSVEQRAKVDSELLKSGESAFSIGLMPVNAGDGGGLTPEMELRIEQVMKSDATAVRHLKSGLSSNPDAANDVSNMIVANLSTDIINKLGERATRASGAELEDIRSSLETIAAAIRAERSKGAADENLDKRLTAMDKARRAASRYV